MKKISLAVSIVLVFVLPPIGIYLIAIVGLYLFVRLFDYIASKDKSKNTA